jgi:hypothetical protein
VIETDNLATEDGLADAGPKGGDSSMGANGGTGASGGSSGNGGSGDTGGGDGATNPDADSGSETDAAPDGPPLGFCESLNPVPDLCADFDTGQFPAGFDQLTQWGLPDPLLDESDSVSSPRSFLITTPTLATASDMGAGFLFKAFQKPASELVIEFDTRLELSNEEWMFLAEVETSGTAGDALYILRVRNGEAQVAETMYPTAGGVEYGGHNLQPPPMGQWIHVRWSLTYSGTSSFSNVTIDGVTNAGGLQFDEYVGGITVKTGMVFIQGVTASPSNVRIDNVVVDVD